MPSSDMCSTANLWEGDVLTLARRFNHDLRSPLGAISTSAEVLKEMLSGQDEGLLGLITGIESSAARSVELISRVVMLLRASYGERPAAQQVSLGMVVDRALAMNEMNRRAAKAAITVPESWPAWTTVDDWIAQVWALLLSNAIKHGGPKISIGCEVTPQGLHCWVRDNGNGLSPEREKEPFPAFEMLHEKPQMHGLGLPSARRLLVLLGASFGYQRLPEGVTEFAFTLPDPEGVKAEPAAKEAPEHHNPVAALHSTPPDALMVDLGPAEREFDTLLSLVRRLTEAPLAFISLLQKDGQVVVDGAGLQETISGEDALHAASADCAGLCLRVIEQGALLKVKKLTVADSPVVRSFLGVPVHGLDGSVAGCLAVADVTTRHWTAQDESALLDFALMARKELRLREKRARLAAAIQRLREDEALNQSLMESSTDCIKLLDLDGHLLDMNGPGRCIMEVDDFAPLQGLAWAGLWPADSSAVVQGAVREARQGRHGRFQGRCPTMKGNIKWWDVVVTPVRDNEGRLQRLLAVSRDITVSKQAELTAKSNEQSLRNVLDSIFAFVGLLTPEGIVLETNASSRAIIGATLESVVGVPYDQTPWWMHSKEEQERIREDLRQAASGKTVRREATACTKDGVIQIDFALVPLLDASGRVTHLVPSATDLTPQLTAERAQRQSEQRLSLLADNMSQFAWITEANGDIFWYNKRWFDYTGTTLEEMRGWGWQKVHHPDHLDRVVKKIRHCFETGELWEDTFPLRGQDGSYRWFLSRAIPIRDSNGAVVQWFGTNTDITEQLEAEQALRKASQAKDDFIAVLSHELRTPLNPVLLIASAATSRDDLPEDVANDFNVIRKNVEMEARLIDDLLDMTRVLRGKLPLMLTTVNFDDLLSDVISVLHNEATPKGIIISSELGARGVRLQADEVRLRQIIWNVMRNAVKFTPPEGQITVITRANKTTLELTIRDTGLGMTTEEMERIFEPFSQGDHAQYHSPGRYGGLGLGLAIAKLLTEQHGGSIQARSEGRHQGTAVILKLPLSTPVPAVIQSKEPTTRPPSPAADVVVPPLSILLIEDHDATRETLALLLKRRGHHIVQASSVKDAARAAASGSYDLLMSDIGLPDGRGDDLLKQLRSEGFDAPAIALSGYGMEADVQRSRDAGFAIHLTKPVSIQELDRALVKIFSRM